MDAILYVDRTGIPWRYLSHDFAPWETVYGYFAAWQKDEVFDQLNGLLRRLVRKAEGRDAEPSACVLDAQSIKTSANVPAAGQGIDAGKKIAGRKRHIGVNKRVQISNNRGRVNGWTSHDRVFGICVAVDGITRSGAEGKTLAAADSGDPS